MGEGALAELALPSSFIIYSAYTPSLLFILGSAEPVIGPLSQKQGQCFGKTAPAVGIVSPGSHGLAQAAIELEACVAGFGGAFIGDEIKTAILIDPRAHGSKSLSVAVRSEQQGEVGNS